MSDTIPSQYDGIQKPLKDHGLDVIRRSAEVLTPDDPDFNFYVLRTVIERGGVSTSGLSTDCVITTFDVSTTPVALPATPLVGRNSISIHNKSPDTILYISKRSDVTADSVNGTISGWEVFPESIYNIDITDNIVLYGVVASGTIKVKVMEVS
jgi:hypothetical protein